MAVISPPRNPMLRPRTAYVAARTNNNDPAISINTLAPPNRANAKPILIKYILTPLFNTPSNSSLSPFLKYAAPFLAKYIGIACCATIITSDNTENISTYRPKLCLPAYRATAAVDRIPASIPAMRRTIIIDVLRPKAILWSSRLGLSLFQKTIGLAYIHRFFTYQDTACTKPSFNENLGS